MEDERIEVVTSPRKYTVSLAIKLPIPNINYSSCESMVSISGDNYDEVKNEAMIKLEQLTLELLDNTKMLTD